MCAMFTSLITSYIADVVEMSNDIFAASKTAQT